MMSMLNELKERKILGLILIARFTCTTLDVGHPIDYSVFGIVMDNFNIVTDNFKIERDDFSIVKDNFKIEADTFFRSIIKI
jgi:hypothetical protein